MIEIIFAYFGDYIIVKIRGNSVLFGNTSNGAQLAPIEGLQLSYSGIIKEFPDLKDDPEYKKKAIARFKDKIRKLKSEKAKADYIKRDLEKHGYKFVKAQFSGRRATNVWR